MADSTASRVSDPSEPVYENVPFSCFLADRPHEWYHAVGITNSHTIPNRPRDSDRLVDKMHASARIPGFVMGWAGRPGYGTEDWSWDVTERENKIQTQCGIKGEYEALDNLRYHLPAASKIILSSSTDPDPDQVRLKWPLLISAYTKLQSYNASVEGTTSYRLAESEARFRRGVDELYDIVFQLFDSETSVDSDADEKGKGKSISRSRSWPTLSYQVDMPVSTPTPLKTNKTGILSFPNPNPITCPPPQTTASALVLADLPLIFEDIHDSHWGLRLKDAITFDARQTQKFIVHALALDADVPIREHLLLSALGPGNSPLARESRSAEERELFEAYIKADATPVDAGRQWPGWRWVGDRKRDWEREERREARGRGRKGLESSVQTLRAETKIKLALSAACSVLHALGVQEPVIGVSVRAPGISWRGVRVWVGEWYYDNKDEVCGGLGQSAAAVESSSSSSGTGTGTGKIESETASQPQNRTPTLPRTRSRKINIHESKPQSHRGTPYDLTTLAGFLLFHSFLCAVKRDIEGRLLPKLEEAGMNLMMVASTKAREEMDKTARKAGMEGVGVNPEQWKAKAGCVLGSWYDSGSSDEDEDWDEDESEEEESEEEESEEEESEEEENEEEYLEDDDEDEGEDEDEEERTR